MGESAKNIVELDVNELIKKLNKALADEWLAYYQYWVGAKLAKGPMRQAVVSELVEHANEELKHAEMLADRIIQLGGTPIVEPKAWYNETNCGYDAPMDPKTVKLLEQNIKGERCAIAVYNALLKFIGGKDPVTYEMVLSILKDEIEHEEDLQSILEDIQTK